MTTDHAFKILATHAANLYFSWAHRAGGFGQFHISLNQDGSITADSESMGRESLRQALHAAVDDLVDKAEIR